VTLLRLPLTTALRLLGRGRLRLVLLKLGYSLEIL
jgi:hypothetical protein